MPGRYSPPVLACLLALSAVAADAPVATVRFDGAGDPLPMHALTRMGTVRLKHVSASGDACPPAWMPDGSTVVTAADGCLRFWDVATGRLNHEWKRDESTVEAFALSPDGKCVAVAWADGLELRTTGGDRARRLLEAERCWGRAMLRFAADGRTLAVVAPGRISKLFAVDVATGAALFEPRQLARAVLSIGFADGGKCLAAVSMAAGREGSTVLSRWELGTGKLLREQELGVTSYQAEFSPDGKTLALFYLESNRNRRVLGLWDVATGRRGPGESGEVHGGAFSSDGRSLVLVSYPADMRKAVVRHRDVATGKENHRVTLPAPPAEPPITLSPDGKTLLASLFGFGPSLWNVTDGKRLLGVAGHESAVRHLAFSADGTRLYSGAADGSVWAWNAGSGQPLGRCHAGDGQALVALAAGPEGTVWTERVDGRLRLHELETGSQRVARRLGGSRAGGRTFIASGLCRLPSGLVLWGSDEGDPANKEIREVDAAGATLRQQGLPPGFVPESFAPDGSSLLGFMRPEETSGGPDGQNGNQRQLLLIDPHSGQRSVGLQQPDWYDGPASWSADGQMVLTVTYKGVREGGALRQGTFSLRLWERRTGGQRLTIPFEPLRAQGEAAFAVLSPDGRLIAKPRPGGEIAFWDAADGRALGSRGGHPVGICRAAFRPDGRALAVGYEDGTILVWDVSDLLSDRPGVTGLPLSFVSLWDTLADEDAANAHRAAWILAAGGADTVRALAERLSPAQPLSAKSVLRLVAELDHARFAVRQAAARELASLAEADPALWSLLEKQPLSPEQRERLRAIGSDTGAVRQPELRRSLRALEVLERIGTPEALAVIKRLAQGPAEARLTRESRSALSRHGAR